MLSIPFPITQGHLHFYFLFLTRSIRSSKSTRYVIVRRSSHGYQIDCFRKGELIILAFLLSRDASPYERHEDEPRHPDVVDLETILPFFLKIRLQNPQYESRQFMFGEFFSQPVRGIRSVLCEIGETCAKTVGLENENKSLKHLPLSPAG